MSLSLKQDRFYWREWSIARRALQASGLSPVECDARRHQVHVEELGEDKSHTEFDEDDFDAVLAGFWKISYPNDLHRQLRQLQMRKTRALYKIDELLRLLGKDRRFAEGVLAQIDHGVDPNSIDSIWQRERNRSQSPRSLTQVGPDDLKKVISGLRSISKRRSVAEPITPELQPSNTPF